MRRTAITVNYLQMLCLLSSKSCFSCGTAVFEEFTLAAGVLLSSKSLLWLLGYCFLRRVYFGCWGTAFFEEFTLVARVLLSSKSCSACCVICFGFFEGLLCLWGCLACWEVISCLLLFSFYKYTKYIWITFRDSVLQALVAGIFSLWAPVRIWVCCGATVLRCCQCNWGPSLTRGNCIGLQCGSATNTYDTVKLVIF